MKRLRIITFFSCCIALILFLYNQKNITMTNPVGDGLIIDDAWLTPNPQPITPVNDLRPPDQTFLTYPEWFLVHGPAEQAEYFKTNTSTTFPYTSHIKQFWESYDVVKDQIANNFEYNSDYHLMINVIGISTSFEYYWKTFHETIVGRITDPGVGNNMTDEDYFNYTYTNDYVNFIRKQPWYNFDYTSRLKDLWTQTSLYDDQLIRKWERKYFISTELIAKIIYGKVIKYASGQVYEEAALTTVIVVDKYTPDLEGISDVELMEILPDSSAILRIPRYAAFNPTVTAIAALGINFKEVTGNTSSILISVLSPLEWQLEGTQTQVIFTQVIQTQPERKRTVFVTKVGTLAPTLNTLSKSDIVVEHIYDY